MASSAVPPAKKTAFVNCGEQALAAKTEDEMGVVLPQLQAAIRVHIRYLGAVAF
jgi:hypothetical protein